MHFVHSPDLRVADGLLEQGERRGASPGKHGPPAPIQRVDEQADIVGSAEAVASPCYRCQSVRTTILVVKSPSGP